MDFVNEHTDTQFRRYCERSGDTYHSIKYPTQVLEYSELYSMAEKECPNAVSYTHLQRMALSPQRRERMPTVSGKPSAM